MLISPTRTLRTKPDDGVNDNDVGCPPFPVLGTGFPAIRDAPLRLRAGLSSSHHYLTILPVVHPRG